MNIDDVPNFRFDESVDVMSVLFNRQLQLMAKYDEIEHKNGLSIPTFPGHIDDPKVQLRIKDMFWRATEEFCEASEELGAFSFSNWKMEWEKNHCIRHFFEEVADAVHFLIEGTHWAGLGPEEVCDYQWFKQTSKEIRRGAEIEPDRVWVGLTRVIQHMGLAANCLKNKPWKNTQMRTDKDRFQNHLCHAWTKLGFVCRSMGLTRADLGNLYLKKNQVNIFRQETNY